MTEFKPDWSKSYYVSSDVAKDLIEKYDIGFDLAWSSDSYRATELSMLMVIDWISYMKNGNVGFIKIA